MTQNQATASTEQKVDSSDLTLSKLFNDFYVVPDFQREYVWQATHVERLLQDIFDEFSDENGGAEYFIGSIVVCKSDDGRYSLIDGQQRMTTCFLAMCVMRDLFVEHGDPNQYLAQRISDVSWDTSRNEQIERPRLELQYEDSHHVLRDFALGGSLDEMRSAPPTASVRNIFEAYESVKEFLAANIKDEKRALSKFFSFFIGKVKLIRIETPELSRALKVFETINDRGVGLNAMDLLKNLMFIRSPAEKHPKLKERWGELVRVIDECQEKPLRFLRYFILSRFVDKVDAKRWLREDEIYKWFQANEAICGIEDEPLKFVDRLLGAAKIYQFFVMARDHQGRPNRYLGNISALSNKATLHFILLLAGQHLDEECFTELTRQLEHLYFCYVITREPTKSFERSFARWSRELANVGNRAELDAFIEKTIMPDLIARSRRFALAFEDLSEGGIQKYRMRYILAKLAQYVDELAWQNPLHTELSGYMAEEVEHILPQKPTAELLSMFEHPEEYAEYVSKLGNLVLLEKSINASIQNKEMETKKAGYRQSKMLLVRAIFEKPQIGQNTRPNRAIAELESFDDWTADSIRQRQEMLRRLAHQVWSVPEPARLSGSEQEDV